MTLPANTISKMRARCLKLTKREIQQLSDLKEAAERDGASRIARRIQAVLLNNRHYTSGEVAERLQASRSRVSLWLRQYERHGWLALLEGHRSGRPKALTKTQLSQLNALIKRGP